MITIGDDHAPINMMMFRLASSGLSYNNPLDMVCHKIQFGSLSNVYGVLCKHVKLTFQLEVTVHLIRGLIYFDTCGLGF